MKVTGLTQAEESAFELEFAEAIHAGFPSPAADHRGERIDLVREMNPHPDTTFYARVEGDSMRDAGILDGDIVVVDRSLEPRSGDFVVAYIDGEYTLKEFRITSSTSNTSTTSNTSNTSNTSAWLIPHNPDFQPIRVTADNDFRVWGVVTHAIHHVRTGRLQ